MPRREIPWEAHSAPDLDEGQRRIVGNAWLSRMKQEHLAVGAFARLTHEVAESGGEPVVLSILARAVSDEARHAGICGRHAALFLGEAAVPSRLRGVPHVPTHVGVDPRARTLLHVVEMCCFNETFTAVGFTHMLERARNPATRAALESLLADEIDHSRVGWAHLATAHREEWGADIVAEALPQILSRTVGRVIEATKAAPGAEDDPALAAHGHLGPTETARIYRETLAKVVFPGLAEAGVPIGDAREQARWKGFCD